MIKRIDAGKKEIELNENSTDQEVKDATVEMYKAEADMVKGGYAAEGITVHDYLEATEYADGTMTPCIWNKK